MKYIVMKEAGDLFIEEFETRSEAIGYADNIYSHLTNFEKLKQNIYVIESADPDEESETHFYGRQIYTPAQED